MKTMTTRRQRVAAVALLAALVWVPVAPAVAQDELQGAPSPDAAQREAVADELARIDASLRVEGDVAAAVQALETLLGDGDIAALVETDPTLRAARNELRDRLAVGLAAGDSTIEEAVREAARRGDFDTLEQFGERASAVIERDLLPKLAAGEDPSHGLTLLLRLSPERAEAFVREQSRTGRLRAASIVFALARSQLLYNAWSNVPGQSPQLTLPGLGELLVAILNNTPAQDLVVVWDELAMLGNAFARHDALSAGLTDALASILLESTRRSVDKFLGALGDDYQWPSHQQLYERLLAHRDEFVRADVAERLSRYRDSAPLRAAVADSSPLVRQRLAELLRPKSVIEPAWTGRNAQPSKAAETVSPDNGDELRSLLVRLSQDDDPGVREAAVRSIELLTPPIERSVLERLAEDPDPGVRAVLANTLDPADESDAALLGRIVRGFDPAMLPALQPVLWDAAVHKRAVTQVVSILRAMPASGERTSLLNGMSHLLKESGPAGINALTRWTLQTGEPEPLDLVLQPMQSRNQPFQDPVFDAWLGLAPDELARLYPIVAGRNEQVFGFLVGHLTRRPSPALAQAMRPLFDDPEQSTRVRLGAAASAVAALDQSLENELIAFLASPAVAPQADESSNLLYDVAEAIPEPDRNRVLLRILGECGLPDEPLRYCLRPYAPNAPAGAALTEAILRRWPVAGPEADEWLLLKALEHAGSLRGQLDPQVLVVQSHNPPIVGSAAIEAMTRQRDPVFLPALAECLKAPWLGKDDFQELSDAAARAITAYMSDDAARILLQGAAEASDSSLRQQCLEGVDTIRRFQDALADWERRDAGRATRDDAVGTLAGMLDDPSPQVRAEALRGLVSLRAVEYLPQIIQGLKDVDAAVREAARQALEQHHRLEAEGAAAERDGQPAGDASDDSTPEGAPPPAGDGD